MYQHTIVTTLMKLKFGVNNINPHSQAQCQVAQANAKPKTAIELVCLQTLTLPTLKKLNLFKTEKTE
jgi:hypothetical protein